MRDSKKYRRGFLKAVFSALSSAMFFKETNVSASRQSMPVSPDPAGSIDSTYSSLATLKSADVSRLSYNLIGTSIDGIFNYETANAPYAADDVNIIKLDSTALAVGALVRQKASSIVLSDNRRLQSAITVLDSFTNILRLIPEAEHAAIFEGTSTYDIGDIVNAAIATNTSIYFPQGTYYIDTTMRYGTSGEGPTLIGADNVKTIFKAGAGLISRGDPVFWFGNNTGHGTFRMRFENFCIDGGDATLYVDSENGAGAQGTIGIRLQECGYSFVGNFWIKGCTTAIENNGGIGTQIGGDWSMMFFCRKGIVSTDPEGRKFHGISELDPDIIDKTVSPLTLNTNVCRYQNIVFSAVGQCIQEKGGLTRISGMTLQGCGFDLKTDLIHILEANESHDYGGGPIVSDLWSEGGKYRSVIRIETTRNALVRDSFFSLNGVNSEQGIIIKDSDGAKVEGCSFRGTATAIHTESRVGNHAFYVHGDSKDGWFGPNYFAQNQITPHIEWVSLKDNHVVVDNNRNNHSSFGITIGAVRIDGSKITKNADLPVDTPFNIEGIANYKDRNGVTVLGTQQAAVDDCLVSAATDPTKAEFTALVKSHNALLARLRAHGIIAT